MKRKIIHLFLSWSIIVVVVVVFCPGISPAAENAPGDLKSKGSSSGANNTGPTFELPEVIIPGEYQVKLWDMKKEVLPPQDSIGG